MFGGFALARWARRKSEELVVIGRAADVVIVMRQRAAEDAGQEAMRHPRKVVSRMGFGEKVSDDEIVRDARKGVLGEWCGHQGRPIESHALHCDIGGDLQEAVAI